MTGTIFHQDGRPAEILSDDEVCAAYALFLKLGGTPRTPRVQADPDPDFLPADKGEGTYRP